MTKDPQARLPFTMNWAQWLAGEGGDIIESVEWSVPDGITQENSPAPSHTDDMATLWLSGGSAGQTYDITCRVLTAGGRIDERTLSVTVTNR